MKTGERIKLMEINLTLEHIFGAVVLSSFLSMFLTGQLLIRSIVFVFFWQIFTPTCDVWYLDILMCAMLFVAIEFVYFETIRVFALNRESANI